MISITRADILSLDSSVLVTMMGASEEEQKRMNDSLLRQYHPDICADTQARELTDKILSARKLIGRKWRKSVRVEALDGRSFGLTYGSMHDLGYAKVYSGATHQTYHYPKNPRNWPTGQTSQIPDVRFDYPTPEMEKEFSKYFAKNSTTVEAVDGRWVVVPKPEGHILLADYLTHYKGKADPAQVVWILSRLFNICCFLQMVKTIHGALGLATVCCNPMNHLVFVPGGWEFSYPSGMTPKVLPVASTEVVGESFPPRTAELLDLILVKKLGLQLLGDSSGMVLKFDPKLAPLVRWLSGPVVEKNAIEVFVNYSAAVDETFGPKTFRLLPLSPEEVFKAL